MGTLPNDEHIDERSTFETIPAGWYRGVVTQTEQVETKNGGVQLKITFEVIEGEYESRKVFERATLFNDNPKAVEIGLRLIKQLKIAAGKPTSRQEEDFWDIPVLAKVSIEKDKNGQYDDKNRIREFKAIDAAPTQAPAKATAAATPTSGDGAPKKAWRGR